jgi:hypothetical protein
MLLASSTCGSVERAGQRRDCKGPDSGKFADDTHVRVLLNFAHGNS